MTEEQYQQYHLAAQNDIARLFADLESLKKELESEKKRHQDLNGALKFQYDEIESLKKENQNLRLQLMTRDEEINKMTEDRDSVWKSLNETIDERNFLRDEIDDQDEQLTALTTKAKEQEELLEKFYQILKKASATQMGTVDWITANDALQAYETYKGKPSAPAV